MIYTGIDNTKKISISYSPLRKEWEFSRREGRKIYVIPSHLSLLRIESTDIKNKYSLRKYLDLEVREKYGDVIWDVEVDEGTMYLAIFKDFDIPEDFFALDLEIFSLARVLKANGKKDGVVLDIGSKKTTYVEVEEGKVVNYRVVLKGGEYIDGIVSESYGIDKGEAEELKKERGVSDVKVREAVEDILNSIGHNLKGKEILLSGGGSLLKGMDSLFDKVFRNDHCEPHLNSAFGASLKYVYKDKSPSFRKSGLEPSELRKMALVSGIAGFFLILSYMASTFFGEKIVKDIKALEKKEFKEAFPNLPAVSVYSQVKSLISGKERFTLTKKIEKLTEKLRRGVVIYSIEYAEGRLIVRGEADENTVKLMEPKSIKKTPKGKVEFEIEIK